MVTRRAGLAGSALFSLRWGFGGISMSTAHSNIESLQQEKRVFPPPPQLARRAWIKSKQQYEQLYRESIHNPEKFWEKIASALLWFKCREELLDSKPPYATRVVGAKRNIG